MRMKHAPHFEESLTSGPGEFAARPRLIQADMELKEVTHCRLAMLAFSGMVTQAVLTNAGFPYTG